MVGIWYVNLPGLYAKLAALDRAKPAQAQRCWKRRATGPSVASAHSRDFLGLPAFRVFLARHQIYGFVVGVSMVVEARLLTDLRQRMVRIGSAVSASW